MKGNSNLYGGGGGSGNGSPEINEAISSSPHISDIGKEKALQATNTHLKNYFKEAYRKSTRHSNVGNGSLQDAIIEQRKNGTLVGGKDHIEKGHQRLRNLQNILRKEKLNRQDTAMVNDEIKSLKSALGVK